MENLIRCCVLRRLIWFFTVCRCPMKRTLGLYGFNGFCCYILRYSSIWYPFVGCELKWWQAIENRLKQICVFYHSILKASHIDLLLIFFTRRSLQCIATQWTANTEWWTCSVPYVDNGLFPVATSDICLYFGPRSGPTERQSQYES